MPAYPSLQIGTGNIDKIIDDVGNLFEKVTEFDDSLFVRISNSKEKLRTGFNHHQSFDEKGVWRNINI